MKEKLVVSSGNVFADLGFEPGAALANRLRSELMTEIHRVVMTYANQTEAAAVFAVSQPRISDLVRGHIDKFSIDTLVEMLGRAGRNVEMAVSEGAQRAVCQEIEINAHEFEFVDNTWKPETGPVASRYSTPTDYSTLELLQTAA